MQVRIGANEYGSQHRAAGLPGKLDHVTGALHKTATVICQSQILLAFTVRDIKWTGAPEFATSLVAALRKRTDVAVANMIGSNIFNILGILGLAALITPVPVAPALIRSDMLWMIGTTLLLLPIMRSGARLSRGEGVVLTGLYVTYLVILLGSSGS